MATKTKEGNADSSAMSSLVSAGKANATIVEDLVNRELGKVLKQRKLKKIEIKGAIFSHLENGLIISGPISIPGTRTSYDLRKKARPVGFLVNTLRLVDPVSRRALEPGVSLVEMRPLRGGEFAFDYIGGDGKVKMATDTNRPHRPGNGSDTIDSGGTQPPDKQHFDIEVNHVIVQPGPDDLPWPLVCTSYHDGTEKCHYAVGEDDDLGFTILS